MPAGAGVTDEARRHHICGSESWEPFAQDAIEQTLQDRFEQMVLVHHDCVAVVDGTVRLTFGQLDAWANRIAQQLAVASVRRGDRVAILAEQSAGAVAAVLGVLKTGAAYMPLDPGDSTKSLRQASELAQITAAVATGSHMATGCALAGGRVVDVGPHQAGAPSPPSLRRAPADLAYVFFTSGSTGSPKGVFDNHRNVLHNVLRYTNTLRVGPADRLSLVQPPTFSGTVSTVFAALCNGATLYPYPVAVRGPVGLATLVREEALTMLHSVPAIFRALVRAGGGFPSVRVVRLEGDRATARDVELHRSAFGTESVVVNGLGATETGLVRQLFLDAAAPVEPGVLPVGYPVPGVDVVLLNEDGSPAAPGQIGEIGVTGEHLALGYVGDPDRTSERFIDLPGLGRTYRSGDIGRLRDDGCLEIHGRVDFALKVRGERPEPALAEAELLALDTVSDAVAGVRETATGATRLVAWVTAERGASTSGQELRRYLAARLSPPHAPSSVLVVDALPYTAHGKIDGGALPDPFAGSPVRAPAGALEGRLTRLWEDVLEIEPIGADESFFDLGGDSLAAAEIVAAAEREAGRPLDAAVLLEAPTIAQLAELIESGRSEGSPLVCMRHVSGTRLLLLAHDARGHLWGLQPLTGQLDCSVWGFRQPVGDDAGWTIEEHAARLCAAARTLQPEGPYLLGGHCFGAVLAFEAARQLVEAGEPVALLLLMGISPWDFKLLSGDVWRRYSAAIGNEGVARRTARALADARALGFRRGAARVARAARSAPGYVRIVRGARDRGDNADPVTDLNLRAFARYQPRPFHGTATLLVASETTARYTDDPVAAWEGLASDVVVHVLSGGDHDMLRPPGVSDTARLVRNVIAQTVP